jgi:hypothetical protein
VGEVVCAQQLEHQQQGQQAVDVIMVEGRQATSTCAA